jgi:hypothetical protein
VTFLDPRKQASDVTDICHVDLHPLGRHAFCAELGGSAPGNLPPASGNDHGRAGLGKPIRHRSSDSRASPGDERHLSPDIEIRHLLRLLQAVARIG